MDIKKLKEILKKSFGKEKDTRLHAIVMLCIYFIFMLVLVLMIRIGNNDSANKNNDNKDLNIIENEPVKNEINYTYSYIINFDNNKETYLGKKIDNKEIFTYINNETTLDYAIIGDNYLIKENDKYHITDKLNTYFRYCDMEKIINMINNYHGISENNYIKYEVNNLDISNTFNDTMTGYCGAGTNLLLIEYENDTIKKVTFDLSNYISCITGTTHTLNLSMEFISVGTTENFNIEM